ncbi:hypothetical protein [Microbacterium testaceum]|uniref:hypothetical protein n=1 Tax=Microbacterium testaceum TaxID=2033 RepID=UPI00073466CF|nr:hypothetical protein [Microbacterium testaceum]
MTTTPPTPTGTDYPGKMLGIAGLIAAFPFSLIGLILSIVAFVQSRKAGYQNVPALIGIIVGAMLLLVFTAVVIVVAVMLASIIGQCAELGPGTHYVDGAKYTCS